MKELTVLLYGEQTNNAVIKLPDRMYPGILIQIDTLENIIDIAKDLVNLSIKNGDLDLIDEAEGLFEMLKDIHQTYSDKIQIGA